MTGFDAAGDLNVATLLIVMYILAGSFVLVGLVGGSGMQLEKFSIPPVPRATRITALTFGTFFFAIALYFTTITTLRDPNFSESPNLPAEKPPARTVTTHPETNEPPITSQARVAFGNIRNGDPVERDKIVTGTAFDISPDQNLWIVVRSVNGSVSFPQAGPIHPSPTDGSFEVEAFFGSLSETKPGDRFFIIPVVASKADNDELVRYRGNKMKKGLPAIPGTEVEGRLTVVRR